MCKYVFKLSSFIYIYIYIYIYTLMYFKYANLEHIHLIICINTI